VGEDPRQIRREIEETRARMSATVDAIGYRTDVKSRTRDAVTQRKDALMDKAGGIVNKVVGAMPDAPSPSDVSMPEFLPDGRQVKQVAQQGVSTAQANPLGLGVAAAAVGFLIGMLMPSTRAEDERLGDFADDLKQQARDAGHEAVERGKTVAQETAQQVSQTVQESARREGQELGESLRESAEGITSRS